MTCSVRLVGSREEITDLVAAHLPPGPFRRICIKPNWVKHQEHDEFPIRALVTGPLVIEATIEACLKTYEGIDDIVVGDVPLQTCDWQLLGRQAGVDLLRQKYERYQRPGIRFLDLRREAYRAEGGFFVREPVPGDPMGYREITLGADSFLDAVTVNGPEFRVSDYSPGHTRSAHAPGVHRYLISGSVLASELLINLPKMKTHQKAGLTGALKNLVGVNGDKAFLAHYRAGQTSGGDEFMPGTSLLVVFQSRLRERYQKRSRAMFGLLKFGWTLARYAAGIETFGTRENLSRGFYVAGGAWYGNDTIWRMVYDLNRIVRFAAPGGTLSEQPQRECLTIVDGITAGEGNGPLQPLPVETGVVTCGSDPFLVDLALSRLMGLDYGRIPCIANHPLFARWGWGNFAPATAPVEFQGNALSSVLALPTLHKFIPPPGWRGHIERLDRVA